MLFGSESISSYTRANISLWMLLAFQAGLLNIGGLLACHSFVSHVTGFATLLGLQLSHENLKAASGMLLVPTFFLFGAMVSGFSIDLRLKLKKKPKYYMIFGLMFVLLLSIVIGGFNGFFGRFGEALESTGDYTLLVILCFVCGVQNGAVTLVSKSVVRTTHLTGITTDLGIGIVRYMNFRRIGGSVSEEGLANLVRFGTIVFFIFGSFIGVYVFERFQYRGFILPTAISGTLFFTTLYFQLIRKVPVKS